MNNSIWKAISYFFHPIIMPTLGFLIVLTSDSYIYLSLDMYQLKKILFTDIPILFVCTGVLPLLFSGVLVAAKRVSSVMEPTEQDRRWLIAFSELGFLLAFYVFHRLPPAGVSLYYFILGINVAMMATLIASLFTKISLHTVGIGGIVGTVIGLMYLNHMVMYPLLGSVMGLAVVIGVARYKLKAHEPADIYIGYIIGMASQAAVFMLGSR
jgi:hypothetical protein